MGALTSNGQIVNVVNSTKQSTKVVPTSQKAHTIPVPPLEPPIDVRQFVRDSIARNRKTYLALAK